MQTQPRTLQSSLLYKFLSSQCCPTGSNQAPALDLNGRCTGSTPVTGTKAQDILKQAPFAPTNPALFSTQTYGSAATAPAAARNISTTELKGGLTSTLLKRNYDLKSASKIVAQMDDSKLTAIIPDARIRAGLLSLNGTIGSAAIDSIKNGDFSSVTFGTPSATGAIAQVNPPTGNQTKPSIVIDSKYQYEDFRLLGDVLSHETLHKDSSNSPNEELIANVIDTTVYGQMLLSDPKLATSGTELSRRLNTKLMARINSRDVQGNLTINSAQSNVYPGGNTSLPYFAAAFQTAGSDSPGGGTAASTLGNATLLSDLKALTGKNLSSADFNSNTVNLIDQNQKALSAAQIVQIAKTLGLKTN